MKALPVLGALLLAACRTSPVDPDDTAIAHGGAAPSQSAQAKLLTEQNVPQDTGNARQVKPDEERPGPESTPPPAVVEFAQVRLDLKNPQGNKAAAYYLLKPDEWMIDKVVMISPTVKEVRFRRVTSGNRTPDLDPLRSALDPNAPPIREARRP